MESDLEEIRQYVRLQRLDLATARVLSRCRDHLTTMFGMALCIEHELIAPSVIAENLRQELLQMSVLLTEILQNEIIVRIEQKCADDPIIEP